MRFFKRVLGKAGSAKSEAAEAARRGEALLAPLARPCWVPQISPGQHDRLGTGFGGRAALEAGESMPRCGACGTRMPLWLQLDLARIPARARDALPERLRSGMLQFFYCTHDQCDNQDFGAFAPNQMSRIVPTGRLVELSPPSKTDHDARPIAGWQEETDFPGAEEAGSIVGAAFDLDDAQAFYDARVSQRKPVPIPRDKLAGWPDWVQSMYYPECPTCNKPMTYLFQITSEDHIPFMFGDAGIGHLCFCPNHPNRGAFYWACC